VKDEPLAQHNRNFVSVVITDTAALSTSKGGKGNSGLQA
jgi:hypothetical protein